MSAVSIQIVGLEDAVRAIGALMGPQVRRYQQQALNREGGLEVGRAARDIRAALPVKLKYIRRRIVWRNADTNGRAGRLRFYGSGKESSAWIRPRHMNPAYPTSAPSASVRQVVGRRARSARRRAAAVTYGVGGSMPEAARRSVLRGFVSSVGAGRKFTHSYQPGFVRQRAQVFQRLGPSRMPIVANRGVTVGTVAARIGLGRRSATRLAERAAAELQRRIDRELAARARRRTSGR